MAWRHPSPELRQETAIPRRQRSARQHLRLISASPHPGSGTLQTWDQFLL